MAPRRPGNPFRSAALPGAFGVHAGRPRPPGARLAITGVPGVTRRPSACIAARLGPGRRLR
jgi:hypothetical protein